MWVKVKASNDPTVHVAERGFGKLRRFLEAKPLRAQRTTNPVLHSAAWSSALTASRINKLPADVVNLHWVCDGFLSVEEIGAITKPAVWTLHDMWAFSGAEHYVPDENAARWRDGYARNNRSPLHGGLDVDRWVWRRKRKAWKRPFHIVAPSRWLADCVRHSALMRDWPVTVIPYTLDFETFRPISKAASRAALGLRSEDRIVLFGAIGATEDPRKGWDLLQPALTRLADEFANLRAVIFGQSEPLEAIDIGVPLHWAGKIDDDNKLALLYSAADVTVVPSRQDNLPQTGVESQSCGCPVVGFNTSGLSDVVEHGLTGYLADSLDSESLVACIKAVLESRDHQASLAAQARARALRLWSPEVIVNQYRHVYAHTIEQHAEARANNIGAA